MNHSREAILRALSEGQVRSDDRRAVFVGAKLYQQAGGVIIRDLFDAEGGGFFADAELLNRLVREKLQGVADRIAKEGWRWVVAEAEFDREACAGMRRVFAKPVPLSKTERTRLGKLEARYKALFDKYADTDAPASAAAEMERIEATVEGLQRETYTERDIAVAGAFVTLGFDGSVRVERGFIRAGDDPKSKAKAEDEPLRPAKGADGLAPISEKLLAELTAYRTSALRNELTRHPATALVALIHALALATFFQNSEGSCLEIAPKSAWLSAMRPALTTALPNGRSPSAMRHGANACRRSPTPSGRSSASFPMQSGMIFLRIACP